MSRDILLKDNVMEIIESAFRLLNCHAELEDRNNRVDFAYLTIKTVRTITHQVSKLKTLKKSKG